MPKRMYTVDKFLGVDESADGYTELKMGQASAMENWYITDGWNLTVRPGIRKLDYGQQEQERQILCMWAGWVGGEELLVLVEYGSADTVTLLGRYGGTGEYYTVLSAQGALGLTAADNAKVKVFVFGGKLYIMSAGNTLVYEQGQLQPAQYYVPLVITGAAPAGGGTTLENANLLSALRRIEYSADGESKSFWLPEEAETVTAVQVDNVQLEVSTAGQMDSSTGCFVFNEAPAKGVANVEITYAVSQTRAEVDRAQVVNMTLVEEYNGATDTRLFMAGDGSNLCIYSGVPLSGDLGQLYFPAMNEVAVDMSGSAVTGLMRHYGKLLAFKPDGTFTITYEPVTLTDGSTIAGFYLRAANREFGNEVYGQVQTVGNYPRTVTKDGIYEWRITSSYYQDERYAKRVSDPVGRSLKQASRIVTCDDGYRKNYYVFCNDEQGTVLVNRYAMGNEGGLWCVYRSELCRDVQWAVMHGADMVFASGSEVFVLDENARYDAQDIPIRARWESGYMDFGADFRKKYTRRMYVSLLPQSNCRLGVTAKTDRRDTYEEKVVAAIVSSLAQADFGSWTFDMTAAPKPKRIKLKIKKFTFCKLVFTVDEPGAQATILGYDQQVRIGTWSK